MIRKRVHESQELPRMKRTRIEYLKISAIRVISEPKKGSAS